MADRSSDKTLDKSKEAPKAGFGEHLRREREMRGISLDEICSATRISTRFLEALENERWDQLPGGIFNRGFVRAVAHHLGLDEDQLVGEYALATGDKATGSASVVRAPAIPENSGNWFGWLLAVIVIAAIVGGGIYGVRRYMAHRHAKAAPPVVTSSQL